MGPPKALLMRHINQAPPYKIDEPRVAVHFVSSEAEWQHCQARLRSATLMGFDTETRPVFGKNRKPNKCALLQIAVRDADKKEEVFVLDLLRLPSKLYNSTLSSIFLSKDSVKLGQDFYHDLKELAASYPKASCFTVVKRVVEVNELSSTLAGRHSPLSLQKLVYFYLHRKLAKTQQTSNWERRPLTSSQLHYAAADALVLLHLYDELLLRLQQSGKSFQLSDVSNVLDVNLEPTLKCSWCVEPFEKKLELKKHRKTCTAQVCSLEICTECDAKKLVTPKTMERHVKRCGTPEAQGEDEDEDEAEIEAEVVVAKEETEAKVVILNARRKRSLSGGSVTTASTPAAMVKSAGTKKRRKKQSKKQPAIVNPTKPASPPPAVVSLSKSQKKRRKRTAKRNQAQQQQLDLSPTPPAQSPANVAGQSNSKQRKLSIESSLLASDAIWSQISSDHSSSFYES